MPVGCLDDVQHAMLCVSDRISSTCLGCSCFTNSNHKNVTNQYFTKMMPQTSRHHPSCGCCVDTSKIPPRRVDPFQRPFSPAQHLPHFRLTFRQVRLHALVSCQPDEVCSPEGVYAVLHNCSRRPSATAVMVPSVLNPLQQPATRLVARCTLTPEADQHAHRCAHPTASAPKLQPFAFFHPHDLSLVDLAPDRRRRCR